MNRFQRISFRTGAIACIVTALVHLFGHFSPRPAAANETEATLWKLMETYRQDLGAGFERTAMDFLKGFSLAFSLYLLVLGTLGLLLLRHLQQDAAFMRRASAVCLFGTGALLVVSLVYFFLPPIVCAAVATAGFAGALLGGGRAESSRIVN